MKKVFTNSEIFNIGNVLFAEENFMKRKNMKTTVAIRHMMKLNFAILAEKFKIVEEEIRESTLEIFDDFYKAGKATKDENQYSISEEFANEFKVVQQKKLDEIAKQTIEVDIVSVPQSDIEKYFSINDGELTDLEMDVLEMFIDQSEKE